ncbi:MAG: hypothetical protein V4623_10190 [Pseudomonadota bacterium]
MTILIGDPMRTALLNLTLALVLLASNAYADELDANRAIAVFAGDTQAFLRRHVLVTETKSVCGAGNYFYATKDRFSPTEMNCLRQLLSYRFNATEVPGIDFEDSTGMKVSDEDIQMLMSSKKFSRWLGADLVQSLSRLKQARSALLAMAQAHPLAPTAFFASAAFKTYDSTANHFLNGLLARYEILSIDNLVDCD